MMRLMIFFLTLGTPICISFADEDARKSRGNDSASSPDSKKLLEGTIHSASPIQLLTFKLDKVSPGQKLSASLLVKNDCRESVKWDSFSSTCKCTRAVIPKVETLPGEFAQFDFEFDVDQWPKQLTQTFDVNVYATGACRHLRLIFSAAFKDTLIFSQSSYSLEYTLIEPIATFELPIVCSELSLAKDLTVKLSDELAAVTVRIVHRNGNAFAVGSFPVNAYKPEETMGELSLFKGKQRVAGTLVVLRRRDPIEVMPKSLVFYLKQDIDREATGLIKARVAPDKLSQIKVASVDGESLSIDWVEINEGVLRFRVVAKPEILDTSLKELVWTFVTVNQKTFNARTRFLFSN